MSKAEIYDKVQGKMQQAAEILAEVSAMLIDAGGDGCGYVTATAMLNRNNFGDANDGKIYAAANTDPESPVYISIATFNGCKTWEVRRK